MSTQTKVNLSEALGKVAELREKVDDYSIALSAMLDAVRNMEEYKSMEIERAALADALHQAEENAKALAVEAFREDGQKTRPGVTVKTFIERKLEYEYNDARKWAEAHAPELVVMDVRMFEKHALAVAKTAPVPGVKVVETYELRAQIASDLSGFLPEKLQ